jgi:hypothetical protein
LGICEDEFGASVNDFGKLDPRFEHEHACRPPPAPGGLRNESLRLFGMR